MMMRWISEVPSKIVKLVEVRAVSAGRCAVGRRLVSTNSARVYARIARQQGRLGRAIRRAEVSASDLRDEHARPSSSRGRDAVTEVRGRLGHPHVVGDYRSEVVAQPAGRSQMDGI
jgi:hypothetical protein